MPDPSGGASSQRALKPLKAGGHTRGPWRGCVVCDAKGHRSTTLDLHQRITIDVPDSGPDLIAPYGHGLVRHDLRRPLHAVFAVRLNRDTPQGRSPRQARYRPHRHGGLLGEMVSLNHHGGSQRVEGPLRSTGHEIAAPHPTQLSRSAKASSIRGCLAVSALSAKATRRDWRRHPFLSHVWTARIRHPMCTGRNPAVRRAMRCL